MEGRYTLCRPHVRLRNIPHDHDVGTVEAHTRAASVVAVVAEPVGDAVFNLVSYLEPGLIRRVAPPPRLPARTDRSAHIIGVASLEAAERLENAQCGAAAHVGFV